MSNEVLSQEEFLEVFKTTVQADGSELHDFSEGSMLDIIAGAIAAGQNEISELVINEFMKTYFSTASGPTDEDPVDHLQYLAVDQFGSDFSRPLASKSTGTEKFVRLNTDGGDVPIAAGTIIKTVKDSNGKEIRFQTTEDVILTGFNISAPIEAMDESSGTIGQVSAGKITVLETTLSDPTITVTNDAPTAGGENAPNDAEYLEIIRSLILALAGATEAAVEGKIKSVPGVAFAKLLTLNKLVIELDPQTQEPYVDSIPFRIPYPVAYVADADGNSSDALLQAVRIAVLSVRAAGVRIDVKGSVPVTIDQTSSITLNPAGPNFAALTADVQPILDTMEEYINKVLNIGDDFVRSAANAYVLSVWGPAGTNDLTVFSSSVPSGDVAIASNQKTVAGSLNIV